MNKELNAIIEAATDRNTMREVSSDMAENIKNRTRDGLGVNKSGQEVPLKSLRPSTVTKRRQKKLHISTTPETSNLTETGRMLDSLEGISPRAKEGIVRPSTQSNRRKTEEVQKIGFRYFKASLKEQNAAAKLIQKKIDDAIRKFNNK